MRIILSGLPGQEGLDRTAVDIQQFATGGDRAGGQQQEPAEGGVDGGEDSEEGGVSSIVSSTEQQAGQGRRARQAIVWEDQNSGGSTSSSPQRHGVGVRNQQKKMTNILHNLYPVGKRCCERKLDKGSNSQEVKTRRHGSKEGSMRDSSLMYL